MVGARIGWGLRGKPAGSHDEYTVLASGGPVFGRSDFAGIFTRFSPGNPPAGRAGPGALPWTVFSAFQDDQEHYLGLTVQDWSNDTDAAGRPISLSRCFVIPYTLVAENRISYRSLYAALHAVDLPPDGRALELELAEVPEDVPAALVERFGFERVATAASLLLRGAVTITRAEESSLLDRIDFFDAVAALLPRGWRTRFTASTWHDEGSPHLQLAFAGRRRPDSAELDWQAFRPPADPGSISGRYWEQLRELTGVRGKSPADIVSYMASRKAPWTGKTDPATALIGLEDLDRPNTIYLNAKRGRVDGGELRRLFDSGRFRELRRQPQAVSSLIDELVRLGDVDDLRKVEPIWGEDGGGLEPLVEAARMHLRQRTGEESHYLRFAERFGLADRFLAGLLRGSDLGAEPEVEEAAAQLVLTYVSWDRERDYTRTLHAVAENLPVLGRLLHRLAVEPRPDLENWLQALESYVPPEFLEPFSRMLRGDGRGVDATVMARLANHDRDSVPRLLFVAEAKGRLRQVLVEFAHLLIGDVRLGREPWATQIFELNPADEYDQGMLDVLLLWLDRRPGQLERAAQGEWSRYQEGFAAICALPEVASGRERILTRLAEHLREWAWYRDPRQTAAVLALVSAYPDEPDLAQAMITARAAAPELIEDERYDRWRQLVFEKQHHLVNRESMLILTALDRKAEPEKVARLCAELLRRGISPKEIAGYLEQSAWEPVAEEVIRVLTETRRSLLASRLNARDAKTASLRLARLIMRVRGSAAENEFRRQLVEKAYTELAYHYELLDNIATDQADESIVHLDEQVRSRLTEIVRLLKDMLDASRSRKWFGR